MNLQNIIVFFITAWRLNVLPLAMRYASLALCTLVQMTDVDEN